MISEKVATKVLAIADENLKTEEDNKAESEKYLGGRSSRAW